eukprot:1161991-Pelagomonas_calceolata.AAC.3
MAGARSVCMTVCALGVNGLLKLLSAFTSCASGGCAQTSWNPTFHHNVWAGKHYERGGGQAHSI